MSKVVIRGYRSGVLHFKEHIDTDLAGDENAMLEMVKRHNQWLDQKDGMIEFELLAELNPLKRFFRIGTDRSQMVNPHPLLWFLRDKA